MKKMMSLVLVVVLAFSASLFAAGTSSTTIAALPGTLPCFDAAIGWAF